MLTVRSLPLNPSPNHPLEGIMTTGNLLYLLMCLATFGVFSAALAWCSWQQARLGPEMVSEPAREPEAHQAIAA
jgi:hypothetical protein